MKDDAVPREPVARRHTLVWIDAARAVIVRWDGTARIQRLERDVPAHRRGGGHVAHDPTLRARGSPPPDRHRLEHLRQHLRKVADRIDPGDDLELIGPGTVREQLASLLGDEDRAHGRRREVLTRRSARLTEAQLVARVREAVGDPAPRGCRQGAGAF
jgi:hypothetical protein